MFPLFVAEYYSMQLLIIEDDSEFLDTILLYLPFLTNNAVKSALHAPTIQEARALLQTEKPDVVLCDVYLPDGVIFTEAETWLAAERRLLICMTGAPKNKDLYESAINAGVLSFIDKDIDFFENLAAALRKAEARVMNYRQSEYFVDRLAEDFDAVASELHEVRTSLKSLQSLFPDRRNTGEKLNFTIRKGGRQETLILSADQILLLEAKEGKIVIVLFSGKEHEVGSSLKDLEEVLPNHSFVRCHASYIINLNAVVRYSADEVELSTGEIVPISRTYKSNAQAALEAIEYLRDFKRNKKDEKLFRHRFFCLGAIKKHVDYRISRVGYRLRLQKRIPHCKFVPSK
jgi:DNA-binding LytR/AlgR family response regulator